MKICDQIPELLFSEFEYVKVWMGLSFKGLVIILQEGCRGKIQNFME